MDPASATPEDSVAFRLHTHRWEHRLLIAFAPPDAPEALDEQRGAFAGRSKAVRDRDLLLVTVHGLEGALQASPDVEPQPLTRAAVHRLQDRFEVPPGTFRTVLIGKDGTVKRRDSDVVSARSIFDTIDAMPMRQREIRDSTEGP